MSPRYPPRLAPPPSHGGALRRCRRTQSRSRWFPPYLRAFYRRIIRHSAVVKFINYLKTLCSPALVSDSKSLASPKIQSQLIEALSLIGRQNFSELPILLPEMVIHVDKLSQSGDYASTNGFLASVNSLFMKFRDNLNTNDLLVDLKYCIDSFAMPLSEVFIRTANLIDQMVDSEAANLYIESQRLCCSIFYSLNFHGVSEFFKDHMSVWMVEFKEYITLNFPGVDELALAELRAAICENISLYVIKEEEEFFKQGYLSGFVESVLSLLVCSSSHGSKQLIVSAIKFLTAVSKSSHHILLSNKVILHQIYGSIVIPSVMLHDVDEELFDMNPIEFIRKDMEGSNIGTITRIACELLNGIAKHYIDEVALVVGLQTHRCVCRFNDNPKGNWKYIYCAIYLAISLATENAAGTSVSYGIVDFQHIFRMVIVDKLKKQDVTSFPMIKAVSLKFFMLFINQVRALEVLPSVFRLLTSPNYVVHSYAARCIEEFLLVKDDTVTLQNYIEERLMIKDGSRRIWDTLEDEWLPKGGYASLDFSWILPTLMCNLFDALSIPGSEENPYVIKCIMRVVWVGGLTADIASLCIERLTTILCKVCQNPKNALFNHYLFESLAGLIRRVCFLSKEMKGRPCKQEISLVSLLERKLYPILQMILARDISEFFPYAFRLLAELVDLNIPLLSAEYCSQVFDILHLPDMWMSQANIFLPHKHNFPKVIYSKLVSSSAIDGQGYYVLNTVIENLGFEVISPFISHLWVSLFNLLRNRRTQKSVKNIIVFMSLFLLKDGPKNLVSSVNTAVQPNAFQAILEKFWIPNLKLITDPIELKLACVALTRLICECPDIFDIRLWGRMLDSIITLLSRPEQARVYDDKPEIPEFRETISFAPLYDAGKKKEEGPLKDPRQFLVVSLSNLFAASTAQGRKYHLLVISENLELANQSALLRLFNLYNVCIV